MPDVGASPEISAQGETLPPQTASASSPEVSPQKNIPPGMIPMLSPEGKPGYVPQESLAKATSAGYRWAVMMTSPEGQIGLVPREKAAAALKNGYKAGNPGQEQASELPKTSAWDTVKGVGSALAGIPEGLAQGATALASAATGNPLPAANMATDAIDAMRRGNAATPEDASLPERAAMTVGPLAGINTPALAQASRNRDPGGMLVAAAPGIANAALPAVIRGVTPAIDAGVAAVKNAVVPKFVDNPLGTAPATPRGTVPAEAATPTDLKAYADAHGIDINAAQATEHNLPRNLQSAGERASVGGTAVRQQVKTAQAQVVQHTQDLMDTMSPNTPDVGTAGTKFKANVQAALEREQNKARINFANVDQQANNGPVPVMGDLKPIKSTASQILQDSDFLRQNVPSLVAKRVDGLLKSITQLPDDATFSQMQDLRSALLDEARHPDNVINTQAQSWIKQLSGETDASMMRAAKQNPNLESAFRDANAHWKGLQEDFNNPRSPLAQVLQEPDPTKIPQKLTQKGQTGGSPYNVGLLDKYGIDKAPVKWAITGDLLNKDFGLYQGGKQLGGYSDNFLKQVYTPQELDSIYKTGAIARSVRLNTNPSGTAVVEGAMSDVQKPVRSMLPKALAAKATQSQSFNDWMMQNPMPPRTAAPSVMTNWLRARQAQLQAAGITGAALNAASQ